MSDLSAKNFIENIQGKKSFERAIELKDYASLYDMFETFAELVSQKCSSDTLQKAAEKATAYTESRFESVHYCNCIPVVSKDSILTLTPVTLNTIKD